MKRALLVALIAGCRTGQLGETDVADTDTDTDADADADTDSDSDTDAGCVPADYLETNWASDCGTWRWDVKTGSDYDAFDVDVTPVEATIAELESLEPPTGDASSWPYDQRFDGELKVYVIRNIQIHEVKLEADSDYHVVIRDGAELMITESPFPGCVDASSRFTCEETRPRAAIEQELVPTSYPDYPNLTGSVYGVAFFDDPHDQNGVAANGIELHPLLGLCWGEDCDPTR